MAEAIDDARDGPRQHTAVTGGMRIFVEALQVFRLISTTPRHPRVTTRPPARGDRGLPTLRPQSRHSRGRRPTGHIATAPWYPYRRRPDGLDWLPRMLSDDPSAHPRRTRADSDRGGRVSDGRRTRDLCVLTVQRQAGKTELIKGDCARRALGVAGLRLNGSGNTARKRVYVCDSMGKLVESICADGSPLMGAASWSRGRGGS